MTNTAERPRTDTATRVILAAPHVLFRACIDPEMLASWRAPDGMIAQITNLRSGTGGGYHIALAEGEATGALTRFAADIRFLELTPEEQIVEQVHFLTNDPNFAAPMTVTIVFKPVIDGTKVTIAASDVPEAIDAGAHEAALAASLRKLALLTE